MTIITRSIIVDCSLIQTSAGMLSSPVALPDEVLLIAEVSSSIVNSWTGIGKVSEMIASIFLDVVAEMQVYPQDFKIFFP